MSREIGISEGTKAIMHDTLALGGNRSSNSDQTSLFGRVIEISLTINDQLYKDTSVLEAIKFEPLQDTTVYQESGDIKADYLVAFKKHSSVRTPVLNEIVPIHTAPDLNAQVKSTQFSQVFYYSDPISLFSSTEHNALPDENTLNNLAPSAQANKLSNYQASTTGIKPVTDKSSTITNKDQVILGDYFTEKGIKPLSPLEGDYKLEGRFGNSIRFGGTPSSAITDDLLWSGPVGNPITIIRNGQQKVDSSANIASLHEDINSDGSSVYMLQGLSIKLVLASDNFDSYGQKINNNASSNVVQQPQSVVPNSQSLQSFTPPAQTSSMFPLAPASMQPSLPTTPNSDLDSVPDDESDFNFVQIGDDIPIPLTQGTILNSYSNLYKFTLGFDPSSQTINLPTAPGQPSKINAINKYAGFVNNVPTISKQGRALVDLIALTEGTMGAGNFNGYDIIVTGKLMPGFTTINSAPKHPNIKLYIPEYKVYSTASGRYQFNFRTWNLVAGSDTTMSRFNQDYACWKNILNSANVPSVLISKMDTDMNIFKQVINLMASQWSSLPVTSDPKGLYGQAGRFTFDNLNTYYQTILQKYQ